MSDYKRYMPEASGHYFTEHLPDDWHTWEQEELDQWCEVHAWQPFEHDDIEWVFEQVDNLALSIHRCVEEATKPLHEEIERLNETLDDLYKNFVGEG